MTSLTRVRFCCRERDCPARDSEEFHRPVCGGVPNHGHRHDQPTHQHIPKKGMGGNNPAAKVRVVICQPMHDLIDNGPYGNSYIDGEYRVWDIHNNTLLRTRPLSGADEGPQVISDGSLDVPATITASASSSVAPSALALDAPHEDGAGSVEATAPSSEQVVGEVGLGEREQEREASPHLSWERWCEMGVTVRLIVQDMPWYFGDWANLGQEHFGEVAWQEISHGFDRRDWDKCRNWMWVAAAYKPAERVPGVSWSHHRQALVLEPQTRRRLLIRARDEGLTRDEMRDLIAATSVVKKREKCWTLEELREARERYQEHRRRRGLDSYFEARDFVDWLAEEADMKREND